MVNSNCREFLHRFLSAALVVIGALALCPRDAAAAFDCQKATLGVDFVICSDQATYEANDSLQMTWDAVRGEMAGENKAHLLYIQREWLAQWPEACKLPKKGKPDSSTIKAAVPCVLKRIQKREEILRKLALRPSGSGSGFFVNSQGYIVTNSNVVEGCSATKIRLPDGSSTPATVLFNDRNNDLAIAKSSVAVPAVANFLASATYRPGNAVLAFGFPLPSDLTSAGVLTSGTINALAGYEDDVRYLQINAQIQPGNSGGPLADHLGNVVGVNSASLHGSADGSAIQNVNFAVKDVVVKEFLRAHNVSFTEIARSKAVSNAQVGEEMRQFSVQIVCYGSP